MRDGLAAVSSQSLPRRRKWLRRLAIAVVLYLLCWGITWTFAPAAVVRWWTAQKATTTDHAGNVVPVEFRAGSRFVGTGLNYWPDPLPESSWWCCVGEPLCPAPFIVATDVAWVDGPLSGYAGRVWFLWTPFGLVPFGHQKQWVA